MASEPPTEGYGRGMRQTRQSQRAREAELSVAAGIQNSPEPSTSVDPLIPQATPSAVLNPQTTSHYLSTTMTSHNDRAEQRDSGRVTPALSRNPNMPPLQGDTIAQQVFASIENQNHDVGHATVGSAAKNAFNLMQTRHFLSHPATAEEQSEYRPRKNNDSAQPSGRSRRVIKPQKSRKKKNPAGRAPTQAPSKRKRPSTPEDNIQRFMTNDQLLQPAKSRIYDWGYPVPKDFTNLPEDLKTAKARADAAEGEIDLNHELDDWHEFCGLESDLFPDLKLKSSIALNFASRAKRAYRAGRSWTSFELEELAIDSRAGARALKDPYQRGIALSSSLSNTLRLYVFEQIKVRLCHEIWLQPYPEDEVASMRDSAIGTAAATPAASEKTALELAPQRLERLPDRLWTLLPGTAQPLRTEPELPGRDRELHQPEGPRIRATQGNLVGLGVYGTDREAGVHLDMERSEEE
jgi:hypothetical protein